IARSDECGMIWRGIVEVLRVLEGPVAPTEQDGNGIGSKPIGENHVRFAVAVDIAQHYRYRGGADNVAAGHFDPAVALAQQDPDRAARHISNSRDNYQVRFTVLVDISDGE